MERQRDREATYIQTDRRRDGETETERWGEGDELVLNTPFLNHVWLYTWRSVSTAGATPFSGSEPGTFS